MNIREITGSPEYWKINREERNYAAILFAALCTPGNAKAFLKHLKYPDEIGKDFCVYFEYSHLRDLWRHISVGPTATQAGIDAANERKKALIRATLGISGLDDILNKSPKCINKSFGVGGPLSAIHIQYPGRWSVSGLHKNKTFADSETFEKLCKFKWAFNIKPDLVIHLNKNKAICVETKYESVEGTYPVPRAEKEIFDARKLDRVNQIDLQEYLLKKLLGIEETDFFCISARKSAKEGRRYKHLGWKAVFDSLCIGDFHTSIQDMARNPKLDAASATV